MERYPDFLDFTQGFLVENPTEVLKWNYTDAELHKMFPLYDLKRKTIFADFGKRTIFDDIQVAVCATLQKEGTVFFTTHFYAELGDSDDMEIEPTYPETFKEIYKRLKNVLPPEKIKGSLDAPWTGTNSIEFDCRGATITLQAQDNGHVYLYKLLINQKK
ncbi:hypothetical protein AD998_15500 [bacterium 336/3]|nr:hypothetical protein AD998_15500 [bacterium 336/3]